jgi:hypothetical protein
MVASKLDLRTTLDSCELASHLQTGAWDRQQPTPEVMKAVAEF